MTTSKSVFIVAGVAAWLAIVAGCGPADNGTTPGEGAGTGAPGTDATQDGDAQGNEGAGSVSLTIGDETWDFDNLLCVTGLEANESDVFSFVAYARGESKDGNRIEFFAEIGDNSGEGRLEGDGVVSYINLNLYSGSDPAGGFVAQTDFGWDNNTAVVTPGGGTVSGDGDFVFEEELGFGAATTPGSFTGICGADSLG